MQVTLTLPELTENDIRAIRGLSIAHIHGTMLKALEETDITIVAMTRFMLHGLTVLAAKKEQE